MEDNDDDLVNSIEDGIEKGKDSQLQSVFCFGLNAQHASSKVSCFVSYQIMMRYLSSCPLSQPMLVGGASVSGIQNILEQL